MEERKSRYDPRKMGKFANVCGVFHDIYVHYKAQNPKIQDLPSATPASYFDDVVRVCEKI